MLEKVKDDIVIKPIKKHIYKSLTVPGSKSITNRALIIAATNKYRIKINNVLVSDDTNYMLNVLKEVGFKIKTSEYSRKEKYPKIRDFIDFIESKVKDSLSVEIGGNGIPNEYQEKKLFTGNSGTTMRFLCSFLPIINGKFTIDGDERMRERPIKDLTNALKQLGININDTNGFPPVYIESNGKVKGGTIEISGKISSQYISSIMLSGTNYSDDIIIKIKDELVSKPFVDMTSKLLAEFGVKVKNDNYKTILIPKIGFSRDTDYFIEPDLTNAFYFLSIPAIIPSSITIYGIGKNTIQGDIKFTEILREIGCHVEIKNEYIKVEGDGNPKGIEIDMNDIPDLVQTLAVIALFSDNPTTIRNVYNLRVKETDRLKALSNEIKKLGGEVEEYQDGIKIIPHKEYKPAKISTYNDHRMAMSFSLAGLRIDGIVIENYKCTSKTFPSYWDYFEFLYQ
ncbi:MAG: 3-phosphoshikimate 1-carboxyvinyltransferase [Brevinematia bacterium]